MSTRGTPFLGHGWVAAIAGTDDALLGISVYNHLGIWKNGPFVLQLCFAHVVTLVFLSLLLSCWLEGSWREDLVGNLLMS